MNTQNVNTAAHESSERWVKDLYAFESQEMGYFSVKYTSHSARGNFIAQCQQLTFAKSRLDAAFKFGLSAVEENHFGVYAVEVLEPIQDVCISTKGYHFSINAGVWRCWENGQVVAIAQDGRIWNGKGEDPLPLYGQLSPIF
jgi:frataxin-like iron-binding protein CyaY